MELIKAFLKLILFAVLWPIGIIILFTKESK